MHYKNGREAKNGDKIIMLPDFKGAMPVVGLLYDARPEGGNSCNGHIAPVYAVGHYANLAECLHVDDFMALVAKAGDAPDTSKV